MDDAQSDTQFTIANLREQFQWWDTLVSGMSQTRLLAQQLPENWSIKDVVAHLAMWQKRSIARLEAGLQNSEPHYPDWPSEFDPEEEGQPHALNAWLYEQRRDTPWPDVYREWHDGFAHLLRLAEATPPDILADKTRFAWLGGYALDDVLAGTFDHHREHKEYLKPVLAQSMPANQQPQS